MSWHSSLAPLLSTDHTFVAEPPDGLPEVLLQNRQSLSSIYLILFLIRNRRTRKKYDPPTSLGRVFH